MHAHKNLRAPRITHAHAHPLFKQHEQPHNMKHAGEGGYVLRVHQRRQGYQEGERLQLLHGARAQSLRSRGGRSLAAAALAGRRLHGWHGRHVWTQGCAASPAPEIPPYYLSFCCCYYYWRTAGVRSRKATPRTADWRLTHSS